jgi:hypothetical protein
VQPTVFILPQQAAGELIAAQSHTIEYVLEDPVPWSYAAGWYYGLSFVIFRHLFRCHGNWRRSMRRATRCIKGRPVKAKHLPGFLSDGHNVYDSLSLLAKP